MTQEWMTKPLLNLINEKNKLWTKISKCKEPSTELKESYQLAKMTVKKKLKKLR